MSIIFSVIGIDPGPTTGLAFLNYMDDKLISKTLLQADGDSSAALLEMMLATYYSDRNAVPKRFAEVESFITSKSAGTKGEAAERTRELIFEHAQILQSWSYYIERRKKADIYKRDGTGWASDKRLKAAGLLGPPEQKHANDAARHALYAAVHDARRPDPLRKPWK